MTAFLDNDAHGGIGVFAAKDIKAGEWVLSYPFKNISLNKNGDPIHSSHYGLTYCDVTTDADRFVPDVLGKSVIYSPKTDFVAHMVNDGATIFENEKNRDIWVGSANFEKKCLDYVKNSLLSQNVTPFGKPFINPQCKTKHIKFFTTRDVKKGDEFMFSYGVHYWVSLYLARSCEGACLTNIMSTRCPIYEECENEVEKSSNLLGRLFKVSHIAGKNPILYETMIYLERSKTTAKIYGKMLNDSWLSRFVKMAERDNITTGVGSFTSFSKMLAVKLKMHVAINTQDTDLFRQQLIKLCEILTNQS